MDGIQSKHRVVLTAEQVDKLADGTEVYITWSGGNGPHKYTIVRDQWGVLKVEGDFGQREWLTYVGEYPLTQVSLVDIGEKI